MLDLDLFDALRRTTAVDSIEAVSPALIPQMCELGNAPFHARVPFFHGVLQLAEAETASVELRCAALAVIAGADGFRARRFLIAQLSSEHPAVRQAAVDAISRCQITPGVLAHALFHGQDDVRTAAIEVASDTIADAVREDCASDLLLTLMADSDNRDKVWKTLSAHSSLSFSLTLLRSLHHGGVVSDEEAHSLVGKLCRQGMFATLLNESDSSLPGQHSVEWLTELFWNTGGSDEFFASLKEWMRMDNVPSFLNSYAELCARLASRTGVFCLGAIEVCVLGELDGIATLIRHGVPRETLRTAIGQLYRFGQQVSEANPQVLKSILASEFCRRPSGQLDLWLIGALMHRSRTQGWSLLLTVVSYEQLVAGFWEDPADSAKIFVYVGAGEQRDQLIERIFAARRRDPFVLAIMLCTMPTETSVLTDAATSRDVVKILMQLNEFSAQDQWKLSVNRTRSIASSLADRLRTGSDGGIDELIAFLNQWLTPAKVDSDQEDDPTTVAGQLSCFAVGVNVLWEYATTLDLEPFVGRLVAGLNDRAMLHLVYMIPYCSGLSYGFEMCLANGLVIHRDPLVRDWAIARVPDETSVRQRPATEAGKRAPRAVGKVVPWNDSERAKVLASPSADLFNILNTVGVVGRSGVAETLASRVPTKSIDETAVIAAALLACGDEVDACVEVFSRNDEQGSVDADEITALLRDLISAERAGDVSDMETSTLALAWLYPWEAFAFRFGERELKGPPTVLYWLRFADKCRSVLLGHRIATSVARTMALWIARERSRAANLFNCDVVNELINMLPTNLGVPAAGLLVRGYRAGFVRVVEISVSERIEVLFPELTDEVRMVFLGWIEAPMSGTLRVQTRAVRRDTTVDVAASIARSTDLQQLAVWLADAHTGVVEDAIVRLIELDAAGMRVLIAGLSAQPPLPCATVIAESVELWPSEYLPAAIELIDAEHSMSPLLRFLVAVGVLGVIDADQHESLLVKISRLLLLPCDTSWVQSGDMDRLSTLIPESDRLSWMKQWHTSSHPHVYRWAVNTLLDAASVNEVGAHLEQFLRLGSGRDEKLRLKVASALWATGNHCGLPLLIAAAVKAKFERSIVEPFKHLRGELAPLTVHSLLAAGPSHVAESNVVKLATSAFDSNQPVTSMEVVLHEAVDDDSRRTAAMLIRHGIGREDKLQRIAHVFARGVQLGRELTGRLFKIEMIGGDAFGYTRLTEDRIFINPIPLLKGVAGGNDIVEGLILHEFGHHLYHSEPRAQEIWKQADRDGLGRLLNVVADEHLERNLRAVDVVFGNQLKRLGAYVFNRGATDFAVQDLIESLACSTLAVLSEHSPTVSRDPYCIRIQGGLTLQTLEKRGQSFARFFRALRLGLGNRHDDPKVAEALALFGKSFRHLDMAGLMKIVYELRRIFAEDANLIRWLNQDTLCDDSAADIEIAADGLDSDDIWREVMRVTRPPSGDKDGKSGGRLVINVGDDVSFNTIHRVVRIPHDPEAHRKLSVVVARHARQFRGFLADLGVSHVAITRRTAGRRVDRGRMLDLVLHHDPRVLISRQPKFNNDLFLAVVVDCSGSMQVDDNIAKAKLFAAMIADACRNLSGVDTRLFGFTDEVIYDCGDASRPCVSKLSAGGGNNDAAALWHASEVAMQSRRAAKVLVMISDGLPTECSTTALRCLVKRLSRQKGLVCAQVAVRPLSEKCFEHYIELTESDTSVAVRRFGGIVAGLVRKSMQSR